MVSNVIEIPDLQINWDIVLGLMYYHMSMVLLKSHRPGSSSKPEDVARFSSTHKVYESFQLGENLLTIFIC
jgi:hypothetical protein